MQLIQLMLQEVMQRVSQFLNAMANLLKAAFTTLKNLIANIK